MFENAISWSYIKATAVILSFYIFKIAAKKFGIRLLLKLKGHVFSYMYIEFVCIIKHSTGL